MKAADDRIFISVIKQYYELGISQEEIAAKEYISKSTVSRIINKAVKNGYVQFKLCYPIVSSTELKKQLMEQFELENAVVTPVYVDDARLILIDVCKAAVQDIKTFVEDGDIIGVSWGRTLGQLADCLDDYQNDKKDIVTVQTNGFVAGDVQSIQSSATISKFQRAFAAEGYLLPVPIFLDSKETATALMNDSKIKPMMDLCRRASLAILSVGAFSSRSVVLERGVLSPEDYERLAQCGTVGDLCSRYFDINGKIANEDMDQRTLGLSLDDLRKIRRRMALAVGPKKAKATIGALRTGAITHLYTDENTAQEIIKLSRQL